MNYKTYSMHRNRILDFFIRSTKGNALPLVLMLVMVVMLIGGAVAYSTMQMYNITRDGYHDQLAYIAAENVLEKSMANLQKVITVAGYPGSRGVYFSGNVDDFLNNLVTAINADAAIQRSYTVKVHDTLNEAEVSVDFQRFGQNYEYTGSMISFWMQIEATADMVDESYSSYGKKAVAVKKFDIPVYTRFTLNGAIYTLGDLLITSGKPIATDVSTIHGDVFVFGTGLDKTNRMQQYYTGGVCSTRDSILHVEGSIFTRNLVRAGTFDDSDPDPVTGGNSSNIIVDGDVVAQGIQVFGTNDNIVVIGDAFTFDDVEMNGADSIIAINGNYFGLNPGDGSRHDTSSAMVNMAPVYGTAQQYQESRIVVNGNIFANGVTFRVDNSSGENVAGHKMESVSMTWRDKDGSGYKPLQIAESIGPNDQAGYDYALMESTEEKNGFSVLWKVDWEYDDSTGGIKDDWALWKDWLEEIRDVADFQSNTGFLPPDPLEVQGYCHYGVAANNTFYRMDKSDMDDSQIKGAGPFDINVVEKVPGLGEDYKGMLDLDHSNWSVYTDSWGDHGISGAMKKLMGHLEALVHVFSQKKVMDDGSYEYTNHKVGTSTLTEFNRLKSLLADTTLFPNDPLNRCVVRYDVGDATTSYLNQELEMLDMNNDDVPPVGDPDALPDGDTTDDYLDYYFLVVNLDPDNTVIITDKFNGIIFSMGKVILEQGAEVHGAIIAAGRGFDDDDEGTGVKGSAADVDGDKTRLPRVVIGESPGDLDTVSNFTNWDYAAIEINNGGDIYYPGGEPLLSKLKENINVEFDTGMTDRQIDLFHIFNVEVAP